MKTNVFFDEYLGHWIVSVGLRFLRLIMKYCSIYSAYIPKPWDRFPSFIFSRFLGEMERSSRVGDPLKRSSYHHRNRRLLGFRNQQGRTGTRSPMFFFG